MYVIVHIQCVCACMYTVCMRVVLLCIHVRTYVYIKAHSDSSILLMTTTKYLNIL